MILYRLVKEKYAGKLTASGFANRWNKEGQFVIYTGSSRSLTTLEMLVQSAGIKGISYKMMLIEINNTEEKIEEISLNDLPEKWRSIKGYAELQKIGTNWYEKSQSLVLSIPSAVIPQERNYIINTRHPEFPKSVDIKGLEQYFWDERLPL